MARWLVAFFTNLLHLLLLRKKQPIFRRQSSRHNPSLYASIIQHDSPWLLWTSTMVNSEKPPNSDTKQLAGRHHYHISGRFKQLDNLNWVVVLCVGGGEEKGWGTLHEHIFGEEVEKECKMRPRWESSQSCITVKYFKHQGHVIEELIQQWRPISNSKSLSRFVTLFWPFHQEVISITECRKFNLPGLFTHSCNAFCSLLTCSGLLAIPTKAIISKNSSSPASHNCWTSSPPSEEEKKQADR